MILYDAERRQLFTGEPAFPLTMAPVVGTVDLFAAVDALTAGIQTLHTEDGTGMCSECLTVDWPCPSRKLADAAEQNRGPRE